MKYHFKCDLIRLMVINMKSQGLHTVDLKSKFKRKTLTQRGRFTMIFRPRKYRPGNQQEYYLIGKNKHTNKKKHGIPFK